jgi:hypothetical protein
MKRRLSESDGQPLRPLRPLALDRFCQRVRAEVSRLGVATGTRRLPRLARQRVVPARGWAADRERCRAAGIPDTPAYRPRWQIGLELYDRAAGHGVRCDRRTFDEGYGGKPDLLRGLSARRQQFVGEVPRRFTGWLKAPRVVTRPYHRRRSRGRKVPRLAAGSRPACGVEESLLQRPLRDQLPRAVGAPESEHERQAALPARGVKLLGNYS